MARALRSSVVGAAVDAYDRHVGRYGPELAREMVRVTRRPRRAAGAGRRLRDRRAHDRAGGGAGRRKRGCDRPVRAFRRGLPGARAGRRRARRDGRGAPLGRRRVRRRARAARRGRHERCPPGCGGDAPRGAAGRRALGVRLGLRGGHDPAARGLGLRPRGRRRACPLVRGGQAQPLLAPARARGALAHHRARAGRAAASSRPAPTMPTSTTSGTRSRTASATSAASTRRSTSRGRERFKRGAAERLGSPSGRFRLTATAWYVRGTAPAV